MIKKDNDSDIKFKEGDNMMPAKKDIRPTVNTTSKNGVNHVSATNDEVLKAIKKNHKKHSKMMEMLAK